MGPGPSYIHPNVYEALSKPTLGHLDPYFVQIMDGIKAQLQELFNTKNQLSLPISGTGSAGMEAVFVNLVEKGDPVLILINGVFGQRMKDVASRLGADVDALEFTWGQPVDLARVKEQLGKRSYKIVAMVHAETSTGVRNPAEGLGELLKDNDALYLLDTVTSLGGIEVSIDKWGVDAVYSGTQKCLSCPPGLSPASFSSRAVEKLSGRKTPVPNWYLDMSMITKYWGGSKRAYHHTAPINMNYALYQALKNILDEGPEKVFQRHQRVHERLVAGLEELGVKMVVDPAHRLPMLNAIYIPDGVEDAEGRKKLREKHKIEIGGGLGDFAGKVWRVGIMGYTAQEQYVDRFLEAIKDIMK
ncbi:MAG TPA: alanine--glyoxylate aminotransferase family protein [Sediminispirochaeta sp.]|nr:alanine--glyoxylate aminotransferase family protein [Sediminispirochaeta sp.]